MALLTFGTLVQTLQSALGEVVDEMERELGPEPTPDELKAFRAGLLSRQDAERVKDHLTVYPEALGLSGAPETLRPTDKAKVSAIEAAAVWRSLRRRLPEGSPGHPNPLARRAVETVRSLLETTGGRKEAHLAEARRFVLLVQECVDELNRAEGVGDDAAVLIRQTVLPRSSLAFLFYERGDGELAADSLIAEWRHTAEAVGVPPRLCDVRLIEAPRLDSGGTGLEDLELLVTFHTAVLEAQRDLEKEAHGREILRRLMVHLNLTHEEVGRMLEVSGGLIREWERGDQAIPDSSMARLGEAATALDRLLEMFRPARLPQVVRREAELFEGRSALEWILEGRIREVADRYDLALTYQA